MLRRLAMLCALAIMFVALCTPGASAAPATWYDLTGNYTASGDILGYYDQTCASPLDYSGNPIYPLGTLLQVTDNETGAWGVCEVTDTGDMSLYGIALDLNVGFMETLGLDPAQGVYDVSIQVVGLDDGYY